MLTQETKRRIDAARDILVGQLPLPSDQTELITIALIYRFMDDMDEQSRELGSRPSFFVGDLRELSWRSLISNTISAEERATKFLQGIEGISHPKQTHIPDLFKSIFKNAFLKFRDGRILKMFLDEINGFTYDHSEELGDAFEYAPNLNKVLEALERHYTSGYGDTQKPDVEIELLPGAAEEAQAFLEGHGDEHRRLDRVNRLIEGFETPYGLELLSSVHWLATHAEPPATDAQDAATGMARWNERKRTMFRQEHIPVAWNRLVSENWITA